MPMAVEPPSTDAEADRESSPAPRSSEVPRAEVGAVRPARSPTQVGRDYVGEMAIPASQRDTRSSGVGPEPTRDVHDEDIRPLPIPKVGELLGQPVHLGELEPALQGWSPTGRKNTRRRGVSSSGHDAGAPQLLLFCRDGDDVARPRWLGRDPAWPKGVHPASVWGPRRAGTNARFRGR
jgi:hypothetical protein